MKQILCVLNINGVSVVANVMVKYLGVIREITGLKSENVDAKNFRDLMDDISKRHEKIQNYLYERETTDPSIIVTYNGKSIKDIKDYDRRLKDGDEITIMTVIGGG